MDTNENQSGKNLLHADEVYAIVGSAMEVHNELGAGFAEAVYQEAMELELTSRGIPFERQKKLRIKYKDQLLEKEYLADLVCYGQIIVEIKAQRDLRPREESQCINYLKVTGLRVGLLINFGDPGRLEWQRLVS
jgi:GxxExxY protein